MARKQKAQQLSPDDKLIQELKDQFKRCEDWEGDFRKLFVEDLRFGNADADNGYQWPDSIRKSRELDQKPCLTINKTKQHCLQIINDSRQNAPAIHIHPINGGATVEAAKLLDGIVRHIEYRSNAQAAYNSAQEFAVYGGIGYWRLGTEYADNESFDQEIYIGRIRDPLMVYLDPDISELDGSDAKFGIIYEDIEKEEFKRKYGNPDKLGVTFPMSATGNAWLSADHIRVCEYFRIEYGKDELAAVDPESIQALPQEFQATGGIIKRSQVTPESWKALIGDSSTRTRIVETKTVRWYRIAGDKVLERGVIPGKYIPIIRTVGEELVIANRLERKGHVRAQKDPQRMYNYWTSSGTEQVALQNKIPYVAGQRAIAGYEKYWEDANNQNFSYLPYNDIDDDGNPVNPPRRENPPVMAQAYIQGMQIASEEMRMTSGQYQATFGANGNETSGVAIQARQRQGDTATYHFIDHLAAAVRFSGKVILSMLPHVYDTPRMMRILGEDGVEDFIHIDPTSKDAHRKEKMGEEVREILNPSIGEYDVVSDTGPAYATRRQEAFNALSKIIGGNSELMDKAGDLLFKAADFPMAQDVAERLARAIPSALKGEGPTPEVIQLHQALQGAQQHMQQMQDAMDVLKQSLAEEKRRKDGDLLKAHTDALEAVDDHDVDIYKAETDRMQALKDNMQPDQMAELIGQLVNEAINQRLGGQ